MTPADLATANAVHFEGVKNAYRQTKDGVVISFVVHPHDVPKGLAEAPLGSRYIVALVQVGDDEQPVHQPEKEKLSTTPATPEVAHDKPPLPAKRMDWRDLQPAAQAGIRCNEPTFWAFLREVHHYPDVRDSELASIAVRHLCMVSTRAELGTKHAARMLWKQLDDQFLAWKHVVA